ncbi:hypothetical protein Tco_1472788, partial [Tanacetum coccineum]
ADFDDDSDAKSEEVLKVGVDLDGIHDADSEEVLKVGVDLDGIYESDMKCDSEGSNEMAGGFFSYVPFRRKGRSSGPFVAGSVNFKDCDENVINCIQLELGTRCKQIRFDANSIDVIDSDNPMFIQLVEKRSTTKDFYRVLFDRGYRCIIVATTSPHFIKIMSDLIHEHRMDLIWLGIQPCDVLALLEIEPGILTTPMTDME